MRKRFEEPDARELTLSPYQEMKIEEDGFKGTLYVPHKDDNKGKALILLGGMDGSYRITQLAAEQFAKHGMTSLVVAYFNQEGLEDSIERIPLEIVKKAAEWLKSKVYYKVGVWGISTGAQYGLLAASYFPELISCAVGVCPNSVCTQGIRVKTQKVRRMDVSPCSAFSYEGKELPYEKLSMSRFKIWWDTFRSRSLTYLSCFKGVIENASEETKIPVERINGPVLLLAPENDTIWYSREAAQAVQDRLKEKNFRHKVEYHQYEYASHLLLPCSLKTAEVFAVERKYPEKCRENNAASLENTLRFLKEW